MSGWDERDSQDGEDAPESPQPPLPDGLGDADAWDEQETRAWGGYSGPLGAPGDPVWSATGTLYRFGLAHEINEHKLHLIHTTGAPAEPQPDAGIDGLPQLGTGQTGNLPEPPPHPLAQPAIGPSPHTPPPHAPPAAWRAWQHSPQGHAALHGIGQGNGQGNGQGTGQQSGQQSHTPGNGVPVPAGIGNAAGRAHGNNGNGNGNGGDWGGFNDHFGYGGDTEPFDTPPPRGWSTVIPGGPGASARQAEAEREAAMATLAYASRRYGPQDDPPNITTLVLYAPSVPTAGVGARGHALTLALDPHLPPNVLAFLLPAARQIYLNPRLFPAGAVADLQRDAFRTRGRYDTAPLWERYVEHNIAARLVLAFLFERHYHYDQYTAIVGEHAMRRAPSVWHGHTPLACAFAPVQAPWNREGKPFEAWHAGYYSHLIHATNQLLCNREQIDAQTCIFLNMYPQVPRGEALVQAVVEAAPHTVKRAAWDHFGRDDDRREHWLRDQAWERYEAYLTQRGRVPRALVQCRLQGDPCRITHPRDLLRMTDQLLADLPELVQWRREVARYGYLLRTQRASSGPLAQMRRGAHSGPIGDEIPPEAQVALYLAEPYSLIPRMARDDWARESSGE